MRKNRGVRFWKISHGSGNITGLTLSEKQECLRREVIALHCGTRAMGGGKITQAEAFKSHMRVGDYFYLCHGSQVVLLGQIISDSIMNTEYNAAVFERAYRVIAQSRLSSPYRDKVKWWSPNANSTCVQVPISDEALFEQLILIPYFGMTVQHILDLPEDGAPLPESDDSPNDRDAIGEKEPSPSPDRGKSPVGQRQRLRYVCPKCGTIIYADKKVKVVCWDCCTAFQPE